MQVFLRRSTQHYDNIYQIRVGSLFERRRFAGAVWIDGDLSSQPGTKSMAESIAVQHACARTRQPDDMSSSGSLGDLRISTGAAWIFRFTQNDNNTAIRGFEIGPVIASPHTEPNFN
jgi:hypothetical protein